MGESQLKLFQPDFNRSIHVEARPERLSTDAGAVLLRELMRRSGLSKLLDEHLRDPRDPSRVIHPFSELVRTAVLLKAHGWSDQEDVDLLRSDPVFRLAVSERRGDASLRESEGEAPEGLCSQPTLSRLMEALASAENRVGLGEILFSWSEHELAKRPPEDLTLDLDSLPVVVHGHQPGSAYNGHYRVRCYHPILLRSECGDYLAARLRAGNAHTADGGLDFVLPPLRRLRPLVGELWLRMDAGFPEPELLEVLEQEDVTYVARLRGNRRLKRLAEPYLRRPPGRPPAEGRTWTYELRYQANTWSRARRVVLVVLERPGEQGHLFLDHFFLLTNAQAEEVCAEALLERYRQRGTAEKDFGEWKNSLQLSLSSTPRPKSHYQGRRIGREGYVSPDSFAVNEAELLVSLLAANLLSRGAALLEAATRQACGRERFRQLLLNVAGRVLLGGRKITLVIESARAPHWQAVWRQIERLHPARGSPPTPTLPTAA